MEGNPIEKNLSENEAEEKVNQLIDQSLAEMNTEELEKFLDEYKELNFFSKNKLEKAMLETKDGKLVVFLSKFINRYFPKAGIDPTVRLRDVARRQGRIPNNQKKEAKINEKDVKTSADIVNNFIFDSKEKASEIRRKTEEKIAELKRAEKEKEDSFDNVAYMFNHLTDEKSLKEAISELMSSSKIYPELNNRYVNTISGVLSMIPEKEASSQKVIALKRIKEFLEKRI